MFRPVLTGCTAIFLLVAPAAEATFPGKPGRIAYSYELPGENQSNGDYRDGGSDIFTINPDGSQVARLTFNGQEPNDEISPAWSPDGSTIAFHTRYPFTFQGYSQAVARTEVQVMAASGAGKTLVPGTNGFDPFFSGAGPSPVFFPSGDRIYYRGVANDGLGQWLSAVGLDGGNPAALPLDDNPPFQASQGRPGLSRYGPQVSPDGRLLLSIRSEDCCNQTSDVFISNIDGTGARNLTNTPSVREANPVFAPDGSAVAFSESNSIGTGQLVIQSLRDNAQRRLAIPTRQFDWGAIPVGCGGQRATLVGTPGRDTLRGTSGPDVITGLGGRDTVKGLGGRDILCGGKGLDRLLGGEGRDRLLGGEGRHDRCLGGSGADALKRCESGKS